MSSDTKEVLYVIATIISVFLIIIVLFFIGKYLLLLLLITGGIGGMVIGCYHVKQVRDKARKSIR